MQGNSNPHERFHRKRANISARQNDVKFVAIFGQDVPIEVLRVSINNTAEFGHQIQISTVHYDPAKFGSFIKIHWNL